jgi:hypothetical protein
VRAKGRLEACLGLAVIDAGAMQDQHGLTLTVLFEVNPAVADSAFHTATLTLIRLNSDRAMPLEPVDHPLRHTPARADGDGRTRP